MSRAPLVLSAAAIFCASSFLALADETGRHRELSWRGASDCESTNSRQQADMIIVRIDTIGATTDLRQRLICPTPPDILWPFRLTTRRA